MNNSEYKKLHLVEKELNNNRISMASQGDFKSFLGHSYFKSTQKFRIIQNRQGRLDPNKLTYVLLYGKDNIMVRVDIEGQTHNGVKTPHIHIFDEKHNNGIDALPVSKINYDGTDDLEKSLLEFLTYNNFHTNNLAIDYPLDL